jgi:hypothetical protein
VPQEVPYAINQDFQITENCMHELVYAGLLMPPAYMLRPNLNIERVGVKTNYFIHSRE